MKRKRAVHIKTQFSIKDLENLSGVKAHTIRIWEKRYNLLSPDRTETNIRKYDLINLKKLLNVTFLYNEGYKISKIANFDQEEISKLVSGAANLSIDNYSRNALKTAMFEFDHELFNSTYIELKKERSFSNIFSTIFIPLLSEIGKLWQTGTIDPSHERFISELIKQKIVVSINDLQQSREKISSQTFALFLPYEEIHEISLLYANYELINAGMNTIYLGENIHLSSLRHVTKHH